jgi:hypothetical protein
MLVGETHHPEVRVFWRMLLGVAMVAAITYFALGLQPTTSNGLPEVLVRVDGESLRLPNNSTCPLAHDGCATELRALPPAVLRVLGTPNTLFAATTPILQIAADGHRPALLSDGQSPVEVMPQRPSALNDWSHLDPDAPGMRLRIIQRADGFWLANVGGKVLGSDPRGPTLVPTSDGPDFDGLNKKLIAFRAEFKDTEDTCALLPSLDTPLSDVVRAAAVAHAHFKTVLIAVP